jgi:DHA1 family bicyclomycin/chloramphenicol resistance-like MFS transporter
VRNYGEILRSPLFHFKTGVVALNFAGLFIYISAAPVFLPQLHLGAVAIRLAVHPIGGRGLPRRAGGQPHGRENDIFATDRHRLLLPAGGLAVQPDLPPVPAAGAAVDGGADAVLYLRHVGGGAGATLLALDLFPHIRGTVASCQSFAVTLLGAIVAGVIAPVYHTRRCG